MHMPHFTHAPYHTLYIPNSTIPHAHSHPLSKAPKRADQVLQSTHMTHVQSTSITSRFSMLVYIRCSPLPAVTAPNPNVAPLPAVDEATLTASSTEKLQNHSLHDPSHNSYLHSPCTTQPSSSITSIAPAPLPSQLGHPAQKAGAKHTSLRSRCVTKS